MDRRTFVSMVAAGSAGSYFNAPPMRSPRLRSGTSFLCTGFLLTVRAGPRSEAPQECCERKGRRADRTVAPLAGLAVRARRLTRRSDSRP